jgi:hypothetical protein
MADDSVLTIEPSKIETVDFALFEWMDKTMDIHATTNKGFGKVPVVWVSGERSFQIKSRKELRDSEGSLIFPAISVERTTINKNPTRRGSLQAFLPPINKYNNFNIHVHSQVKQTKSSDYAATNSKKSFGQQNFPFDNPNVVYDNYYIKAPTYVDMSYLITLRTEYQQQMNEVLQPFIVKTGNINSFVIEKDGHRYEAFIQPDYAPQNNVATLNNEERIYQTQITVNVLAYLYGSGPNDDEPKVFKQEGPAKIKIGGEKTILGDPTTKKI